MNETRVTRVVPVEASEWAAFLTAYDRWCAARQPRMVESGRKAAALRDAEFRESATRFCQAAAQIAYTAKTASPPTPEPQADARDAARLAFLANLYVVARKPARYGSFECFSHSPDPDECEEFDPEALNKLRAAIDRAQESGNG